MEKALSFDTLQQTATKRDLREMESRIILKVGAMISASIAITATLVKLL